MKEMANFDPNTPNSLPLSGKHILITGAARRIGRALALTVARQGGVVILHHGHSPQEALETQAEIEGTGGTAHILQADLADPGQASALIGQALAHGPLFGLVNNAAIFEPVRLREASLEAWNRHLTVNLTAPFLLSQAFASALPAGAPGRIVNLLDWRALRPGADHLPYTISKAGLAALTRSLAIELAPHVTVNGLALGAILPASSGKDHSGILKNVPAARWAWLDEVSQALCFFLTGPAYITGEILHIDGGRHLV
jgi:NAD(P)-dependent dehydrogenase (short-subunit alcohol dehydrogenase family)